jgi:hypothetical protein
VIAEPHNDRACLDAITEEVVAMVEMRDPALVAIAEEHRTPEALVAWIRSLPQRDDTGLPCDGPKVEACRPPQRLRVPADDPNCVERSALFMGAAELIDPEPVRRLATVETPAGLHTFPTEDGEPVILDPEQSRNALRAGLFRARRARNGSEPVALTPTEAVDWIAELAAEPAARFVGGPRRVRNGHRALRAVLVGRPLCIAEVRDVAFLLALADREAAHYGAPGRRVVHTTARAMGELDRAAARRWLEKTAPRNAGIEIGGVRIKPNTALIAALGRVGGRLGYQVGIEALRAKLATLGIGAPFIHSIERELNREGISLGQLAAPVPMVGTFGALTPQALAGRWLAQKI